VPNNGRNCFGRTSRDAGQSRVPAPPHMISGMIRLSMDVPNFYTVNYISPVLPAVSLGSQ